MSNVKKMGKSTGLASLDSATFRSCGIPRIDRQGIALAAQQFDNEDRVDSVSVEWRNDEGRYLVIVNANKGNVGSGNCEFVWSL